MSSVNVKAALMEAREALDNLLADEAMLSEIDRAGEMMPRRSARATGFTPAATAEASATPCILPRR